MSIKDALNRTTLYEGPARYPSKITYPEGNYVTFTYDSRHNITQKIEYAKPGTPGSPAPLTWTAGFSSDCPNYLTCNRPNYIIDARGNRTDYTYDPTHGGIVTETGPADETGVRPQTRYTYTALYAQVKNASGALVNADTLVYKLTKVSTCRAATVADPAACVGTSNETVTEYTYASNNLLKTSETVHPGGTAIHLDQPYSATNLWAKTSYTYDTVGNVVTVDGPREDVDDKTYTTYDLLRRPVYQIGVDPDGAGTLKRAVIKHSYDVDGREYLTETGTGTAITFVKYVPSDLVATIPTDVTDFVATSYTQTTFDPVTGLPVKTIAATKP